jgi:hypothetical protein
LLFHLLHLQPEPPARFATFFWAAPISWPSMPYPVAEFGERFRAGFIWMVLSHARRLPLSVPAEHSGGSDRPAPRVKREGVPDRRIGTASAVGGRRR